MLQVAFIKQNIELVKERLGVKNFKEIDIVATVISLDNEKRSLQGSFDHLQSKIKFASSYVTNPDQNKRIEETRKIVAQIKSTQLPISEKLAEVEKKLQNEIIKLPNLPHSSVPKGKTPEENVIVREGGKNLIWKPFSF